VQVMQAMRDGYAYPQDDPGDYSWPY
jgi:hypothetical protein